MDPANWLTASDREEPMKIALIGAPAGGGVITYLAGGKQYVAVATGITSMSWQTKAGNAKVVVYALP